MIDASSISVSSGSNAVNMSADQAGYWQSNGMISRTPHWLQVISHDADFDMDGAMCS